MVPLQFSNLQTVLCLGAHADDIEIGCGGTILRLLSEIATLEIHWVVMSAADERATEAAVSARDFLADAADRRVSIESFRDAYFPYEGAAIKDYFEELAQRVNPDLIFTHRRDDLHQDHRLVSELTWNTFRDHVILEYEIPKYDGDLGTQNVYIPLPEDVCTRKVTAIIKHFRSQHGHRWFTADTFHGLMRLRGMECNSPTRYAEGFTCRKLII